MTATNAGLAQFSDSVRSFCELIESSETPDVEDMLESIAALVSGARVLDADAAPPAAASGDPLANSQIPERLKNLPFQHYVEMFDPFDLDAETWVTGDIVDDLLDIYRDLKPGLEMFDAGNRDAAAAHWGFHYMIHWGEHATSATRALFFWLRESR